MYRWWQLGAHPELENRVMGWAKPNGREVRWRVGLVRILSWIEWPFTQVTRRIWKP